MGQSRPGPLAKGRCPICGEPTAHDVRPFCSRRCCDIDLARWLSGRYAIAGGSADSDEDGDDALARRQGTAAPPQEPPDDRD